MKISNRPHLRITAMLLTAAVCAGLLCACAPLETEMGSVEWWFTPVNSRVTPEFRFKFEKEITDLTGFSTGSGEVRVGNLSDSNDRSLYWTPTAQYRNGDVLFPDGDEIIFSFRDDCGTKRRGTLRIQRQDGGTASQIPYLATLISSDLSMEENSNHSEYGYGALIFFDTAIKPHDSKIENIIDILTVKDEHYQFYAGEELIDEDAQWLYFLDRTRARSGYVEYADGNRRSIHDALRVGDITREDLNTYGILHTAYSKQYADEPILEWAPMLTVICGDARIDAYRGTCIWGGGCMDAESPAGAKAKGYMDPLILGRNAPGQAVLLFEIAPDALTVRYDGRELEVTETTVTLDDDRTVKAFSIDLMDGSELYEIHADWSSGWDVKDSTWYYTRRNSGNADYGFYVEASP